MSGSCAAKDEALVSDLGLHVSSELLSCDDEVVELECAKYGHTVLASHR